MEKIWIINGVNLNFIGKREIHLYGRLSFDEYFERLKKKFNTLSLHYCQSNLEGQLVEFIQQAFLDKAIGIVINPGAYSHTSVAIADAIASVEIPVVEVHMTNIYSRETFRHQSITGSKANAVISGAGLFSYDLAINYIQNLIVHEK